ncbi:MAG TPA: ferritin-like domain-containing protein [Polyangiaceae bacterium]|nr:ferritin-like domain-containing protein [Polyangiaceae bacterium]
MVRVNPRVLSAALFSALGLAPLACGGAFSKGDSEGGAGDAGSASGGSALGGSATGGAKATGGGNSGNAFPCNNPVPVAPGYERCANGTIHRVAIEACTSSLPRPAPSVALPGGNCETDADCTEKPHGYCNVTAGAGAGAGAGAYCSYGCVTDADCLADYICVCGEPIGQCAYSTCKSDADCGGELRCQSYDASFGCDSVGFACQTPQDACGSDTDCGVGLCGTGIDGRTGASGPFTCRSSGCVDGRPFLVDGLARVAAVTPRSDWQLACRLALESTPLDLRKAAGLAWCRIGQMEHASIAAFARFALQLLSLGAPASLLEAATAAMADETRHAQLAFGVASALLGEAQGPALLDVEGSLLETSLVDVARLVIREGCIGETRAALEARESALHAKQPELAQLLHGIADDESRHAELAWRFVGYALEREPQCIAALLEAELLEERALVDSAHLPGASADELAGAALGILPGRLSHELRAVALREVVSPCAAALLRHRAGAAAENQVLSA